MKNYLKFSLVVMMGLLAVWPGMAADDDGGQSRTGSVVVTAGGTGTGMVFKGSVPATSTPLPVSGQSFNIWRSIGAMLVLMGVLFAVNSYVNSKRVGLLSRRNKDKRIVVLERTAIDHKRSLLLVEADGQRIVIGLGPDRMETIAVLSGPAPAPAPADDGEVPVQNLTFADSLKTLMGKGRS